ncbi:hypothetical protein [Bacillus cereus group sp. BfR-BA-01511]|uniref:hypothetical protein n=1 Tax=Bacillus cereus group sp. BfR-BA-01511 TaxID=2920365 RepID=UPI001F58F6F6|nr:hypothetical protein [Bacillus cereus group sp. BfR-BA-01511]
MHSKNAPTAQEVISDAISVLEGMKGFTFDVLTINKTEDTDYASFLSKSISKLSSIIGNMIELNMANYLNEHGKYAQHGVWTRQDPGFPDNIFKSDYLQSIPGIEVKAWFPFSTEITARFKGSYRQCTEDTYVALIVWLPEYILHGRPKIIDVWVGPSAEIAARRNNHYYNPPNYLILEPQDTSDRTSNLQQLNVEGYVIQEKDKTQALKEVSQWDEESQKYSLAPQTQQLIYDLHSKYSYRLDTNFAKLDRIQHPQINIFKQQVLNTEFHGQSIAYWKNISKNSNILIEYMDLFK